LHLIFKNYLNDYAVRARTWYRQFHDITLTAAVYNFELALQP